MSNIENTTTNCNGLSEFGIVFDGGSGIEEDGYYGISHLIEHCMCEKVKTIEKKLYEKGISWNAYTSETRIYFMMNGIDEAVKEMASKFTDLILNYKITRDVFEREQKIVLTEYNMYASDQSGSAYMNFFRKKYNMYDVCGKKEDIANISYEDFIQFKNRWYSRPSKIVFSHPKNTDVLEKVDQIIDFNHIKPYNKKYVLGNYDEKELEHNSKFDSQRILMIAQEFKSSKNDNFKYYSFSLILKSMLTGGLTSILMQEIREKLGYVYGISLDIIRIEEGKFLFLLNTACESDKVDTVVKKFKEVFSKIQTFINKDLYASTLLKKKSSITRDEFIRFTNILDDCVVMSNKNLTNDSLTGKYDEFVDFVKNLKLEKADYSIDDRL